MEIPKHRFLKKGSLFAFNVGDVMQRIYHSTLASCVWVDASAKLLLFPPQLLRTSFRVSLKHPNAMFYSRFGYKIFAAVCDTNIIMHHDTLYDESVG